MATIRVFKRRAWKRNKSYPGGYEPYSGGRKTTVCYVDSIDEAREICAKHNANRKKRDDVFCEFEQ